MARFDRTVLPGGEGTIVLKLKTRGYQGLVHKSALVYSNDPKQSQVRLEVTAQVKVPISFKPRGVMLDGFIDDDIERTVTITAHQDKPLTLEPEKLSLPEKVAFEIKTVEQGRVYDVVIKNIGKERDRYSGFLTLKTNYPEKPEITIRFLGYIKGNLQCTPESIYFVRSRDVDQKGRKGKRILNRRSVMLKLNKGDNLKIEKIDINHDLFETEVKEIKEGKSYRIDVKLDMEKLPKGEVSEKMTVHTNLKDDPEIVVPIRVRRM